MHFFASGQLGPSRGGSKQLGQRRLRHQCCGSLVFWFPDWSNGRQAHRLTGGQDRASHPGSPSRHHIIIATKSRAVGMRLFFQPVLAGAGSWMGRLHHSRGCAHGECWMRAGRTRVKPQQPVCARPAAVCWSKQRSCTSALGAS